MKRSYKQNCALALASDLLCERWTLLIFRELLIRPCRFKDLNEVLMGMGTNLLSNRLKELEQATLIEKQNPEDKRSHYQLTDSGLSVEPIILQLITWGHSHLNGNEEYRHQAHWDLLAMKALYKPSQYKAKNHLTLQFQTEDFSGWIEASSKGMKIGLGKTENANKVLNMNIQEFKTAAENNTLKDDSLLPLLACF